MKRNMYTYSIRISIKRSCYDN